MTIFKYTMKRLFSSKVKFILLFLCPVIFTLMFITSASNLLYVAIADNDLSELSGKLVSGLSSLNGINVTTLNEYEAEDKLLSYQTDMTIIIQNGFEEAILSGKEPSVSLSYISEKEGLFYVKSYLNGFVADLETIASGTGYITAEFNKAFAIYEQKMLSAENISEDSSSKSPWVYGSFGFLVQFMLYMSIITCGVILEDKNSGVYHRIFYAPVTLKKYFAENLLAFMVVGFLQVTVSFIFISAIFGLSLINLSSIFVLFVVFALVCIALGMWLITIIKKPLIAYLSILFLTTPLVMLGGCYWPAELMPDYIIDIAKFFPTSWVMQAVDKVLNSGADLIGISFEILILLLFAGIFMSLGLAKKVEV